MSRRVYHEEEQITLRRGTFLVLWQLLTGTLRDAEAWKETSPERYEIVFQVDEAERRALHWLAGAIQRGVNAVMYENFPELVAEEKRWIMSRPR